MAEWLRRWTDNLMVALRVGSIPGTGDSFFVLFFYDDDGGATRSGAGERERRRAGMSAANAGAS